MEEATYHTPLTKRNVSHHAAVAIIHNKRNDRFLFDVYGENYSTVDYHGRINLIGGNHNSDDLSPWEIWKREICEEFSLEETEELGEKLDIEVSGHLKREKVFAPLEDIVAVRNAILANAQPYSDFYFETPPLRKIQRGKIMSIPRRSCVYSVYASCLSDDLFGLMKEHLAALRNIKQEGFPAIHTREELVSGKILPAAGTGLILEHYLKLPEKSIPNPDGVILEKLRKPLPLMEHYLTYFSYNRPVRISTG